MKEKTTRHLRTDGPRPTRRTVVLTAAMALGAALPDRPERPLQPALSRFELDSPAGPQVDGPQARDLQAGHPGPPVQAASVKPAPPSRPEIISTFTGRSPRYWGLEAPGVLTRLPEGAPGIAVTVDFCGGPGANGYDRALLTALRDRNIPATLFLNSRWIAANPAAARELAAEPLFELANHGTFHRPLSTTGKSAYGIPGTQNAGEVYDEVMGNDAALTQLTGTRPRFFRAGTAYLDEVAADIVRALGLTPVGFRINGDGGATYPAAIVAREAGKAGLGDIIICHGNHPGSGTAEGMAQALDYFIAHRARMVPIPQDDQAAGH